MYRKLRKIFSSNQYQFQKQLTKNPQKRPKQKLFTRILHLINKEFKHFEIFPLGGQLQILGKFQINYIDVNTMISNNRVIKP